VRILYCGVNRENSGSRYRAMQALGHDCRILAEEAHWRRVPAPIAAVERKARNGPVTWWLNRTLVRSARRFRPDLLWVDKGEYVYASALRRLRRETGATLACAIPDDFLRDGDGPKSRHFARSIPLYDVIFTPRDVNRAELRERGARRVAKFWKGYADGVVRPVKLGPAERERYACDVTFAGHYEPARLEPCRRMAELGVDFRLWGGPEWLKCGDELIEGAYRGHLSLPEYVKALCGAKIALHFLSRWNRDTQSSRSFEIPATGTFMLAERTEDHLACYVEGVEAEFFSSDDEMVEKIRYYLAHEEERGTVAEAGYRRCTESGYSNSARVRRMLEVVEGIRDERADRRAPASAAEEA
jgi:hypothetical protein